MSISLPQYGIRIEGTGYSTAAEGPVYEGMVRSLVTHLATSTVAKAIFHKIQVHARRDGGVIIRPWTAEQAKEYGQCNAYSDGKHPEIAFSGGKAEVRFSPQTWGSSCANGPGAQFDEILVHELVHAMRSMGADDNNNKLSGTHAGYENEEEFFAVVITNIYMSERRRTNLRSDHMGFSSLPAAMTDAKAFLTVPENFRLIEKFCRVHPNIARMIAGANAAFNPIAEYYSWGTPATSPENVGRVVGVSQDEVAAPPITISAGVLFDVGKFYLKTDAAIALIQAGIKVKSFAGKHILVQGFADATGGRSAFNQQLSQQRANAVKDWLVNKGYVSRSEITAKGYGIDHPVATNATVEGRAKNRRVEILVLKSRPRP